MTHLTAGASGFAWGELPLHADAIEATGWGPVAHVTEFVLGEPDDGTRMAYPGERPPGSFVVDGQRVLPVRPGRTPSGWIVDDGSTESDLDDWLAARGEPALADRLAAVGYGSNLNPGQVATFSLGRAVVVLRGVTVGIASAFCNTHRNDGQYPAGITAHDPSRIEHHGLVLIDRDQQGKLDGKEGQGGTYDRSLVSGSSTPVALVLEDGTLVEDDLPVYLQTEERPLALRSSEPVLLADVDQKSFQDLRGEAVTNDHGLKAQPVHRLPRHETRPVPVFVYGTLRPGQSRWPALSDLVESHVPASIHGHRFDTGYGFPGLLLDHPESETVDGDLLHLTPGRHLEALTVMDRIEGHPDLYARHLVRVSDGRLAWVYLWNVSDHDSGGR